MTVNFNNLLHGGCFEKGGSNTLFHAQNDSTTCGYANCGRTKLDCFERVFDLEEAAFW
jgi:hypothetical protein